MKRFLRLLVEFMTGWNGIAFRIRQKAQEREASIAEERRRVILQIADEINGAIRRRQESREDYLRRMRPRLRAESRGEE